MNVGISCMQACPLECLTQTPSFIVCHLAAFRYKTFLFYEHSSPILKERLREKNPSIIDLMSALIKEIELFQIQINYKCKLVALHSCNSTDGI